MRRALGTLFIAIFSVLCGQRVQASDLHSWVIWEQIERLEDRIQRCPKEVARLDPKYPAIYYNLGLAYRWKGMEEEAKAAFDRQLAIDRGNAKSGTQAE